MTKIKFYGKRMKSKNILIAFILISAIVLNFAACDKKEDASNETKNKIDLEVVKIGDHFKLTKTDGTEFDTKLHLNGRHALVFFGYSNCKTICPATLSNIFNIMKNNKELNDLFIPIFISLDPERDTIEVLKEYSKNFDDKIVMLTGKKEYIEKLAKDFKIYHALDGTGEINHSGIIYIMNSKGEYKGHSMESEEQKLEDSLKEQIKNLH